MKRLDAYIYTFPEITTAKEVVAVKAIEQYITIWLILACENEPTNMLQSNNSYTVDSRYPDFGYLE